MKKILFSFSLVLFLFGGLMSQQSYSNTVNLNWENDQYTNIHQNVRVNYLSFEGAAVDHRQPEIVRYLHHIPVNGLGSLEIKITPKKVSSISIAEPENKTISDRFETSYEIVTMRNQYQANISVTPIRATKVGFEKLEQFEITVVHSTNNDLASTTRDEGMTTTSVLSNGTIFKIAIAQEGVYSIDGNFLKENFNIDLSTLNTRNIQLFGNIGGRLPNETTADQPDDLTEIPLLMNDGGDDKLADTDNFVFYAEGADRWSFDNETSGYSYDKNIYSVNNFVFLKIDGISGSRVQTKTSEGTPSYSSSEFDFLQRYEDDRTNLLGAFVSTEGTGKEWYGDYFSQETSQSFDDKFDISDLAIGGEGLLSMRFAARGENQTTLKLVVNDLNTQKSAFGTNLSDIEADYAKPIVFQENITLKNSNNKIDIEYVKSIPQDEGWLDYIQLQYRKKITNKYSQIRVSDSNSLGNEKVSLTIPSSQFTVWDVTNINNTSIISPKGSEIIYDANDALKTFYMVRGEEYLTPQPVGRVENQNIHSIERADLIIVYHPNFVDATNKLAQHRRDHNGYNVATVNILNIYNEFSSGRIDATALRDFSRMVATRDPNFQYLLLLGDGSYDYRNVTPNLLDHNFIPVYETDESLNPIEGFPSDDYYALLSDGEGDANLKGALDVAVGRLPVTSADMANDVINKVISYDTNKKALGDWRLRVGFAADDEDGNLHVDQADALTKRVANAFPIYNHSKIYFDSYLQESTPGGDRYPGATEAINSSIQNGMLVLNYMGHGGPKGWSQERVLKIPDIETWENNDQLPILITATCSFTGYDDPSLVSAGEVAIQKANGGVVALLTTVRAVYASDNERLARAAFDVIFDKVDGKPQTLGEIITKAKNKNADSNNVSNDRKFSLIGDPSQRIAVPTYNVNTTTINGQALTTVDTLNALEKVTITGNITDESGQILNDFNGTVFPTIFDKESTLETLKNDDRSKKKEFGIFRSILFKGSATVTNGEFEFTFVMPKDINYDFGTGRISYYAHDGERDAAGNYNEIFVGGSNPNAVADDEGPTVELFMNDEKFVFGGTTNASPILLALLSDDLGINVSGTSIGHDITAILDEDTKNSFILNDFYEANTDEYTSGKVRFPLKDLSTGKHTITLKAWDVSNNSTEGLLEFTVINQDDESLRNVYNYPNPFTTNTSFMFEHDLVGSDLEVYVDIYTVSGKLVKTIQQSVFGSGFRVDNIKWNARDDFDSSLAKGIYLYKIKVISRGLNQIRESDFEKLVIL